MSLAEALRDGRAAILVLTLVADCFGSGLCERARQQAVSVAERGGLSVIVEQGLVVEDGEGPVPSESGVLSDWALENDPWIYVVGSDGVIVDRFERLALDAELEAAVGLVERCFNGGGQIASVEGKVVAHGVGPGDAIPTGVADLIEAKRFDPGEFERTAIDPEELGLFVAGASRSRPGFHDVAAIFVLVQSEDGGPASWVAAEWSWLEEVGCE